MTGYWGLEVIFALVQSAKGLKNIELYWADNVSLRNYQVTDCFFFVVFFSMLSIRWSDYDHSWVSLKAKNLPPLAHLIDCICHVSHTHMIYVLCLQDCVSTWVKNKLSLIHNKTFANLHNDATKDLKCLYDQILDTHFFFLHFRTQ